MDKYYYLVSQLSTLYFDRVPHLTNESFLNEAAKWLSPRQYGILVKIDIDDVCLEKKSPGSWKNYQEFENSLRRGLSIWRKSLKEGNEVKKTSFPINLVKEGNPFQIEKNLLKYRWDFIEEISKEHDFDLDFLVLYYLKLQILYRLSIFNKKEGFEKFFHIVEELSDNLDDNITKNDN